ncbi:hypothetical protein WJX84_009089 [Apatococcus fuscideae]|uniref:Uncharacterized protein n=1 Tax=Apatococcus fuscideae TaxID=2026836 RepID=A0AAW1SNZ3_9CHLO
MGKALDTLHERPSALHDKENGGNHHGAPACGKSMTTGYCDSNDMTAGRMTRSSARTRLPLHDVRQMSNLYGPGPLPFPDGHKFAKQSIVNHAVVPRYFLRDHLRSPSKAGSGPTAVRSDSEASPTGDLPMFDAREKEPEPGATPMPRAFGSILRDLPEAPRKACTESPDALGTGSSLLPSGAKSPLAQSAPVRATRRVTRYRPRLRARARRVLDLHANGKAMGDDQRAMLERRQTRASALDQLGENGPPPVLSGNVRKAEDQTVHSPMDTSQVHSLCCTPTVLTSGAP